MANIARIAGDFEATQALAVRQGNITARIITYAGNPNGATITPAPTAGTICIDSLSGDIWKFITGTSWTPFTTGALSATGLDWKQSARVASTANIANLATGAPNSVDGKTLVLGDRVLVKNQTTNAQENGIYTVTTVGTGSNGVWARAADANTAVLLNTGSAVFIEDGAQAGTLWILTTPGPIVLGTTALTFSNFGTYTAGSGIGITTGVISAVADPSGGLSVTGSGIKTLAANNAIAVSASGIGVALATTSGLSTTSGLTVVAQSTGGINISGSGLGITVAQQAAGVAGGLTVTSTGIGLSLDATPGLQTAAGLKVLVDPAGALAVGTAGVKVNIDSSNNSTAIVGNNIVCPGAMNTTIASVTVSQVVDSIPIATYGAAKWLVCVKNATTGRYASEIFATNLGAGTTADYTEYGVVQVGSFTTVPTFVVTSDGTNMILTFTGDAGNALTVSRQAL
jgi:hypothetical protein